MELYPSAAALPGVNKLLRHLHKSGVPLAIATSSSRAAVQAKRCNHEALFACFDAIVTAEDIVHGKPAPDIFLAAAEALGVPPGECVVFEDAIAGVVAGLAAGCVVVAAPDRRLYTGDDELLEAGFGSAHEVLDTMEQFEPQRWGFPPFP
jgi:pseudouridine-5'-monophosphatase